MSILDSNHTYELSFSESSSDGSFYTLIVKNRSLSIKTKDCIILLMEVYSTPNIMKFSADTIDLYIEKIKITIVVRFCQPKTFCIKLKKD